MNENKLLLKQEIQYVIFVNSFSFHNFRSLQNENGFDTFAFNEKFDTSMLTYRIFEFPELLVLVVLVKN